MPWRNTWQWLALIIIDLNIPLPNKVGNSQIRRIYPLIQDQTVHTVYLSASAFTYPTKSTETSNRNSPFATVMAASLFKQTKRKIQQPAHIRHIILATPAFTNACVGQTPRLCLGPVESPGKMSVVLSGCGLSRLMILTVRHPLMRYPHALTWHL